MLGVWLKCKGKHTHFQPFFTHAIWEAASEFARWYVKKMLKQNYANKDMFKWEGRAPFLKKGLEILESSYSLMKKV